MRFVTCLLAIFTCCKKSINYSKSGASLGPTFGQVLNLFSKLVFIIARLPKRSLRISRASWYASSGSCTREFFQGSFGFAVQVLVQEMQLLSSCYRCRIVYALKGILPQKNLFFFLRHCLQKHQASHAVVAATG